MNTIREAYEAHVALLARSDVAEHRENAASIALAALKKRRAAHARCARTQEPYRSQWLRDLACYDATAAEIEANG